MARSWQLWLSPRPSRSMTANDPFIMSPYDGARFDFLTDDEGRWVIRETHYIDNPWVKEGHSGPTLHIHWKQTEHFQVEKGSIAIHKNGRILKATKDSGVVQVPAGTRHKFWAHESCREDLVFKVWADPQGLDNSFDEKFIRNLIGYQRDCQMANMKPSLFQLALIAYDSATLVTPPFWMPLWLLRGVQKVVARAIGGYVLGYKPTYAEYFNDPSDSSKSR